MSEVTRIFHAIESGDPAAADQLLPLVYEELRRLARHQMAHERVGHTLQPTALVHEAYVRLVGAAESQTWENRRHFFRAAARAMRRILIDRARRKAAVKRGGGRGRVAMDAAAAVAEAPLEDLLALDEALARLKEEDTLAAQLVELRYFAGLTMQQAAEASGLSLRTAERNWTYARAWLRRELSRGFDET